MWFRGFMCTARSLDDAVQRICRRQAVFSNQDLGVELFIDLAFVALKVFTTRLMPPEKLSRVQVVEGPCPITGKDIEGVLVQLHDLPSDVPHYTLRLSSKRYTQLQTVIVDAQDLRRKGQAKDTWDRELNRISAKRPSVFRPENIVAVETFPHLKEQVEETQARLRAAEIARTTAEDAAVLETSVRRVTAGRFGEDDDDEADDGELATARAKAKSTGKSRAKRASGGGRGIGRRSVLGRGRGANPTNAAGGAASAGALLMAEDGPNDLGEHHEDQQEEDESLGIKFLSILEGGNYGRELRPAVALAALGLIKS